MMSAIRPQAEDAFAEIALDTIHRAEQVDVELADFLEGLKQIRGEIDERISSAEEAVRLQEAKESQEADVSEE